MRFPKFHIERRSWLLAGWVLVGASACRLDMHDAPLYEPLEKSSLWANGQSSRTPVPGTVARGQFRGDQVAFYTGKTPEGMPVKDLPSSLRVDAELLETGRQKYEVFCSPCHGYTGYANGMIVQRGYPAPPSFHSKRLKEVQMGHFYDVITNGWGRMYSYGHAVRPEHRWAIAAYIRALQLSQDFEAADLTAEQRARLERGSIDDDEGHGAERGGAH